MGASWLLVACGSSHGPTGHAEPPQLVYDGGSLLASPRIVSVTFLGDSQAADLQAFGATIAQTPWWDTVRADLCNDAGTCVGQGPPGTSVQIPTAAPATLTDSDQGAASTVQRWLSGLLDDRTLPAPDPGATSNTIYVLYYPMTTAITFDGLTSCTDGGFGGYHNSMMRNGQLVAYAVVAECAPLPSPVATVTPLTDLETTTVTSSHEILETASDPNGKGGFTLDLGNVQNWAWVDVLGGDEAADLCVDPFGINQDATTSGAYTVQRIWSNKSAAAGHDPCVPAPAGRVYFNAAPRNSFYVLSMGESATVEIDTFADGATPDWTLAAQDWSANSGANYLGLSIVGGTQTSQGPKITVNRGRTVVLKATLLADPSALPTGEADGAILSLSNDPTLPVIAHWWPFAVMMKAKAVQTGINPAVRVPTHRPARHQPAAPMMRP